MLDFWTAARLAQLRKLAKDGHSFGSAAEVLGCSRNAIAGKALREGVSFASDETTHRARTVRGLVASWSDPAKRAQRIERCRRTRANHA